MASWASIVCPPTPVNDPVSPVCDLAEALADPQAEARGVVWCVPHSTLGEVPLAANALRHMSRTPAGPAGPLSSSGSAPARFWARR